MNIAKKNLHSFVRNGISLFTPLIVLNFLGVFLVQMSALLSLLRRTFIETDTVLEASYVDMTKKCILP